jgi:ketosteroid isomerase-like protein
MSSENVELIFETIRRFRPGDLDEWAELWHPDARLTGPKEWPEPGPFVGLDAIIRQFDLAAADLSEFRFDNIEVVADSGDWTVVSYRWHTRGVTSGLDADFDLAGAYRVENGLVMECHLRWRPDEALDAAGLSD